MNAFPVDQASSAPHYSHRNAVFGSIRIARSAGSSPATREQKQDDASRTKA
jgi:hypothetical protein